MFYSLFWLSISYKVLLLPSLKMYKYPWHAHSYLGCDGPYLLKYYSRLKVFRDGVHKSQLCVWMRARERETVAQWPTKGTKFLALLKRHHLLPITSSKPAVLYTRLREKENKGNGGDGCRGEATKMIWECVSERERERERQKTRCSEGSERKNISSTVYICLGLSDSRRGKIFWGKSGVLNISVLTINDRHSTVCLLASC